MERESLSALSTPALILDVDIMKRNADRMIERCQKLGVQLRPHMKTHKTLEGADILTGGSRRCIEVSTVAEACFYADHGYDDILYAYPLPLDKVERCAALSEKLELFQVLLCEPLVLEHLKKRPLKDGRKWKVWMKLDCGRGRAGVLHSDPEAVRLAQAISEAEGVELTGIYVYCGNTYRCQGKEQIQAVAQESTDRLLQFMEKLKAVGITCKSSMGSTPSCTFPVKDMARLDELHPGSYAFFDVQNSLNGYCSLDDVAVKVLTRVIGHTPHMNQLLIDCGWSGLRLVQSANPSTAYALIEGHPDIKLLKLSHEHGIAVPTSGSLDYSQYPLGTLLMLIPYNSSATALQHPVYHVHSGGRLVGQWTPTRGW